MPSRAILLTLGLCLILAPLPLQSMLCFSYNFPSSRHTGNDCWDETTPINNTNNVYNWVSEAPTQSGAICSDPTGVIFCYGYSLDEESGPGVWGGCLDARSNTSVTFSQNATWGYENVTVLMCSVSPDGLNMCFGGRTLNRSTLGILVMRQCFTTYDGVQTIFSEDFVINPAGSDGSPLFAGGSSFAVYAGIYEACFVVADGSGANMQCIEYRTGFRGWSIVSGTEHDVVDIIAPYDNEFKAYLRNSEGYCSVGLTWQLEYRPVNSTLSQFLCGDDTYPASDVKLVSPRNNDRIFCFSIAGNRSAVDCGLTLSSSNLPGELYNGGRFTWTDLAMNVDGTVLCAAFSGVDFYLYLRCFDISRSDIFTGWPALPWSSQIVQVNATDFQRVHVAISTTLPIVCVTTGLNQTSLSATTMQCFDYLSGANLLDYQTSDPVEDTEVMFSPDGLRVIFDVRGPTSYMVYTYSLSPSVSLLSAFGNTVYLSYMKVGSFAVPFDIWNFLRAPFQASPIGAVPLGTGYPASPNPRTPTPMPQFSPSSPMTSVPTPIATPIPSGSSVASSPFNPATFSPIPSPSSLPLGPNSLSPIPTGLAPNGSSPFPVPVPFQAPAFSSSQTLSPSFGQLSASSPTPVSPASTNPSVLPIGSPLPAISPAPTPSVFVSSLSPSSAPSLTSLSPSLVSSQSLTPSSPLSGSAPQSISPSPSDSVTSLSGTPSTASVYIPFYSSNGVLCVGSLGALSGLFVCENGTWISNSTNTTQVNGTIVSLPGGQVNISGGLVIETSTLTLSNHSTLVVNENVSTIGYPGNPTVIITSQSRIFIGGNVNFGPFSVLSIEAPSNQSAICIQGDLTLDLNSSVVINITDTSSLPIEVLGCAHLAGSLRVSLLETPSLNTTTVFPLIKSPCITGDFDSVSVTLIKPPPTCASLQSYAVEKPPSFLVLTLHFDDNCLINPDASPRLRALLSLTLIVLTNLY